MKAWSHMDRPDVAATRGDTKGPSRHSVPLEERRVQRDHIATPDIARLHRKGDGLNSMELTKGVEEVYPVWQETFHPDGLAQGCWRYSARQGHRRLSCPSSQ